MLARFLDTIFPEIRDSIDQQSAISRLADEEQRACITDLLTAEPWVLDMNRSVSKLLLKYV